MIVQRLPGMGNFNLEHLLARNDLTPTDKIVLLKLIKLNGRGNITREVIANECSISPKTLQAVLSKLRLYKIIFSKSEYIKICTLNMEMI